MVEKGQVAGKQSGGGPWNLLKEIDIGRGNITAPQFANILDFIASRFPAHHPPYNGRNSVLLVDEAHVLRILKEHDAAACKAFLDFVVRITKQDRKVHVVFTSSDSFFLQWLVNSVGIPISHMNTLVLGDMTKEEARDYFDYAVDRLVDDPTTKANLKALHFDDDVFPLTGGRPYFIQSYVIQSHRPFTTKPLTVDNFGPIVDQRTLLMHEMLDGQRAYGPETLKKVMLMLIESAGGYIDYTDTVKACGRAAIHAMIQRNILHYRPPSDFTRDLVPSPEVPVLTPQSVPALRAMEWRLLKQV